jgi:hypothetical protein
MTLETARFDLSGSTSAEDGEALLRRRPRRWIDHWDPENPGFWDAVGAKTAKRNLVTRFCVSTSVSPCGLSGR